LPPIPSEARNAKQVDGFIGALDFRLTKEEAAKVERG